MSKIVFYIAVSEDGFIARKNGDVDWLPQPKSDDDLIQCGYTQLIDSIDTIIMGSKSYRQIVSFGQWAWPDKHTYVFTSKPLKSEHNYISFTQASPKTFINDLKNRSFPKDIWLLGGAELAKSFAKANLIDEVVLTVIPQKIGEGIKLELSLDSFDLIQEKSIMGEMLQKVYFRK